VGAKVGKIFQNQLEDRGVKFRMNSGVESAEPSLANPSKVGAVLLKGGEKLEADLVILGVGVVPATEYLKQSGIELEGDASVKVDGYFRVESVEDAYAVGMRFIPHDNTES